MLEIWWRDWDGNCLEGWVEDRKPKSWLDDNGYVAYSRTFYPEKSFTVERRGKKYILLEGPMKLPRYTTDNLEDCKATANAIVGIYDDD